MIVRFNSDVNVAGLGLVPWTRLGPERWLPSYKIASLYGWDLGPDAKPEVLALSDRGDLPELKALNTTNLLQTPQFRAILEDELAGYAFLTYKSTIVPKELAHRKFLMVDASFTQRFENKVWFRQQFSDKLRFPGFKTYFRADLHDTLESYDVIREGREAFVVQDEQIGGGKGTFIVRSYDDWQRTLAGLAKISQHKQVVVSSMIQNPRERSIQGCVTKDGIVTGPLQRQFVAHPLLANLDVVDGDKYCGAQILAADQGTATHTQATAMARTVGGYLAEAGYRGIFGVDFLLDEQNELYVLEVNPRITGVTPLLAAMFGDDTGIPFYLLHILELGDFAYEIVDNRSVFERDGALTVLHSPHNEPTIITALPKSGTYEIRNDELVYLSDNIVFANLAPGQFILQEYIPPNRIVPPGRRVMTALWNDVMIDKDNDKWYDTNLNAIRLVHKSIQYKAA